MSVEGLCTMPVQDDLGWGSPLCLSALTGLEVSEDTTSLDDFNMLDELDIDVDKLFPGSDVLLQDSELGVSVDDIDISMDDFAILLKPKEANEVKHDCMWAGHCVSVDHSKERSKDETPEKADRPDPEERLHPSPVKTAPPKDSVSPVQTTLVQPSRVMVKTNQRSLLRTSVQNPVRYQSRTAVVPEDSDDSGRPETPQSLSEGEDDGPIVMKHDDRLLLCDEDADDDLGSSFLQEDEDSEPCKGVSVSEVTGQQVRSQTHSFDVPSSLGHTSRVESRPTHHTQVPVSTHFISDHSYYLSKNDVSASIPGNLTPSDSEEDEIDVVSVSGSVSRSSSQGGSLPTNPSARDRQALQQSVASGLKKSAPSHHQGYHQTYPTYPTLGRQSGKLARMHEERQRQRERKRRAQERDDSSEEDMVRPTKKRAKHHVYKNKRSHTSRASSSDSEPDSCEKRSLHNNMERQRRVDLRNAFEDLRVEVPTLNPNPRAAKVVILKEASLYCHQLTADSRMISQEMAALKREQERLLARVSHLRKQRANTFK